MTGIYIILNTKNHKAYIGKAKNIKARWRKHRYELNDNIHHNNHLQSAWNKYGAKAFKFKVLEYCSADQMNEREQYHVRIYRANKLAYNLTDGGDGGTNPSEETRRKIGAAQMGKPKKPEAIAKTRAANIGRKVSAETRSKIGAAGMGRKHSVTLIEKRVDPLRKEYHFVDPEGNEVHIKGLYRFCRENGLCGQHMASVANGKRKHHKGWKAVTV